ncbi:MAG: hypothetical protein JWQ11_2642, partial [Rhizobacter sp.]|nr:hypothetical protein [Rhizobacter sp.]
ASARWPSWPEREDDMHIDIIRDPSLSTDRGTFGRLLIDGAMFCVTCEQPWAGNVPNHSCIPLGDYALLPYDSPAHGPTFVFHNPTLGIYGTPDRIPAGKSGRSLCEVHNANWPFQLKGCVGVGQQVTDIAPNGRGVTASVTTFGAFMGKVGPQTAVQVTISAR